MVLGNLGTDLVVGIVSRVDETARIRDREDNQE